MRDISIKITESKFICKITHFVANCKISLTVILTVEKLVQSNEGGNFRPNFIQLNSRLWKP